MLMRLVVHGYLHSGPLLVLFGFIVTVIVLGKVTLDNNNDHTRYSLKYLRSC